MEELKTLILLLSVFVLKQFSLMGWKIVKFNSEKRQIVKLFSKS